jgi:hypothetical protein
LLFSSRNAVDAALFYRAFGAALLDLDGSPTWSAERRSATILQITKQLLAAAETGERDPERLKLMALDGVARTLQ